MKQASDWLTLAQTLDPLGLETGENSKSDSVQNPPSST